MFRILVTGLGAESLLATTYVYVDKLAVYANGRKIDNWSSFVPVWWVGQAVRLSAEPFPVPTPIGGVAWSVDNVAVGGYSANTESASVTKFSEISSQTSPTAYWVTAGLKNVTVVAGSINATGRLFIKRPDANVTSRTDDIHIFKLSVATVEFGNIDDPTPGIVQHAGILFKGIPDPKAPPGAYQWVQLVNADYHRTILDNSGQLSAQAFGTDSFWLDNSYPYNDFDPRRPFTADSPNWSFDNSYVNANESQSFRMYFMWKFGAKNYAGSIWVPLRLTEWQWSFFVHKGPAADAPALSGWKLDSGAHSTDPPSQDTTSFPEWSRRLAIDDPEQLDWHDED